MFAYYATLHYMIKINSHAVINVDQSTEKNENEDCKYLFIPQHKCILPI